MLQCSSQMVFVQCNMAKLPFAKASLAPDLQRHRDKTARSTPVYSNFSIGLSW
jgi:hypothetical protein